MKKCLFGVCCLALLVHEVRADAVWSGWRITSAAEEKLQAWAEEGKAYRPKLDHIHLFCRAQLKYRLSLDNYLHRWYDRPLLQNSALAKFDRSEADMVNPESGKLLKQAIGLGHIDGMGFYPSTSGRTVFFDASRELGITIMPEFTGNASDIDNAERTLNAPNAFRYKGKVVFTIYPVQKDLQKMKAFRENLVSKFGDKFALVPYSSFMPKGFDPVKTTLDVPQIEAIAEHIRSRLRDAGGFYIGNYALLGKNARIDNEIGLKLMVPILHKVMSEPEFQNKLLGFHWMQGLENSYRWTPTIDSEGVETLRKHAEFIEALRPDFCILPEWDEENENSCFRPMVDTGWSSIRMIRYYAARWRGEKPAPFPQDDLTVPGLILSYRKHLLAGEGAEYLVTNVPDGTPKRLYELKLSLLDSNGKTVFTFPEQLLDSDECRTASFIMSSALLLRHQILRPRLEVRWQGGEYVAQDGLWPQDIRADWNCDWRWAKQPLRELLPGVKTELTAEPARDGMIRLRGKIDSPSVLAQAEILEGSDTVWMADSKPALRETDDQVVLKLTFQSITDQTLSGKISLDNAPSARLADGSPLPLTLNGERFRSWTMTHYVSLSRAEAEKAVLRFELPPHFHTELPVQTVLEKHRYALSAPGGGVCVISRFASQKAIPEHIDGRSADIDVLVLPRDPKSVYMIRVVDQKGRIWRGNAFTIRKPSGKEVTFPVFDKLTGTASTATADESLITCHVFDFSPGFGALIPDAAGRKYWGIFNSFWPQASDIGSGESDYGSLPRRSIRGKKGPVQLEEPRRIREPEGFDSLEFKNGAHAALPIQAVPMYAGFQISFKINVPQLSDRSQTILSTGSHGFNLTLRNGVLRASIFLYEAWYDRRTSDDIFADAPAELTPGKWHDVVITFDQKQLVVTVDGVPGIPKPVTGRMFSPKAGGLGMGETLESGFEGRISTLEIRPYLMK